MNTNVIENLKAAFGEGRVFTGEAIGADFCHDEYPGGNFAPDAVVEAQSTDDVSAVLKICSENDVQIGRAHV